NCGGHAFATEGLLLGPILEEFKAKRGEIAHTVAPAYNKGLIAKGYDPPVEIATQRVTVQGGIGTAQENSLMHSFYEVDGTGWATPFLLVPEVANVDEEHLAKLAAATDEDVYLSESSPLSVSYWMLRGSSSEHARLDRIAKGKPGSPCPKGFLYTNKEFSDRAICLASRRYQKEKLRQIEQAERSKAQRDRIRGQVLDKACICHELGGGVTRNLDIDMSINPTVCCGPNIVNFSKVATMDEMVGHIYGRGSLLTNVHRPHMFVRELMLYVDEFGKEIYDLKIGLSKRKPIFFEKFENNLRAGIAYYHDLVSALPEQERSQFVHALKVETRRFEQLLARHLADTGVPGVAPSSRRTLEISNL
ncbi:MAG: hypothetical protein JRF63_13955, partial [Deltaproteobacteria bacterium]|nr:hypothetical protein [Deltaproteobacteria bacterium]